LWVIGEGQGAITVAVDPREQRRVVRPELLRREGLATILVEPAEPGGRVARELGLVDEAIAVVIGGLEGEALIEARRHITIGLLGHGHTHRANRHRASGIERAHQNRCASDRSPQRSFTRRVHASLVPPGRYTGAT
jgi:hypothetical protein